MTEVRSNAQEVRVGLIRETTFGVTPTNPEFVLFPVTNTRGLSAQPIYTQSDLIDGSRQIDQRVKVNEIYSGDMPGELKFRSYDELIQGVMQNPWVDKPTITNTAVGVPISAVTGASKTYTVAAGGTAFTSDMIVEASGFALSGNNVVDKVASSTATTVVFVDSAMVNETNIPVGATLKAVGFVGGTGDLQTQVNPTRMSSTTLNFTTLGLSAGQWIKIGGSSNTTKYDTAANNKNARILSVSANTLTFDLVGTGFAADTGTGKTIKCWSGDYLTNGKTNYSYTFENQYLSHNPINYTYFRGLRVSTLNIAMPTAEKITISFGLNGTKYDPTTTRITGATDGKLADSEVFNSSSNFRTLIFNGTEVVGPNFISNLSLNIDNQEQDVGAVGFGGPVDIAYGAFNLTGSLDTYLSDFEIQKQALLNNKLNLMLVLGDNDKNELLFDVPQLKLTDSKVGGDNINDILTASIGAETSDTYKYTLLITRFNYVERG